MWIRERKYRDWIGTIRQLETCTKEMFKQLAERDATIVQLREREDQHHEYVRQLTERLRFVEVKAATHAALSDTFRVQVNTLNSQVAGLLGKIVPGLDVAVPLIERHDLPNSDPFEDIGDTAARAMGLADEFPLVGVGRPHTEPQPPGVPGDD